MHQQFIIQNLYIQPAQYLFSVFISKQAVTFAVFNIN